MLRINNYTTLLTLLSAALFVLMLPFSAGAGLWPIQGVTAAFVWIFLVPMWSQLRRSSTKQILIYGFVFCFLSSLGTLYWVFTAFKKYGHLSTGISLSILLAFILAESTIRSLAFLGAALVRNHRFFPFLAATFFGSVDLWMYIFPFHGFPWITASHAVYPLHHMVQIADLIGIQGINFFVYLIQFLVIEAVVCNHRSLAKKYLATAILVLLFFWTYGFFRLGQIKSLEGTPLRVALLQGNIAQDLKWNQTERERILQTYRDLSQQAIGQSADLIVWPEASFPKSVPSQAPQLPSNILPPDQNLASATFVVGAPSYVHKQGKTIFKNSAFITDGNGMVVSRYDKHQLVPFGEYVPNILNLPIEKWIPAVAGSFLPGDLQQDLPKVKESPFGLFICYEALFPKIARAWSEKGAQFFVAITNDAWFDQGSGPFQHVQFAGIRAVEFRKPVVRAANTGITTWYDATGKQHSVLSMGTTDLMTVQIHPNTLKTFYSRFPWLTSVLFWIISLVFLVLRKTREEHS